MSLSTLSRAPVSQSDGGALALSALAAVFWGTNFEATRIALIDLPPWTAAAERFAIAAVAIMLWLGVAKGISWCVLRRNIVAMLVLGRSIRAPLVANAIAGRRQNSATKNASIVGSLPTFSSLGVAANLAVRACSAIAERKRT